MLPTRSTLFSSIHLVILGLLLLELTLQVPAFTQGNNSDFLPPDVTVPMSADIPTNGTPAATPTAPTSTVTPDPTSKTSQQSEDPLAILTTNKGVIVIRLFQKYAPNTVANFIELCQSGFYNGLTFHRVEPGFVIQGGDPNGNGSGLYMDPATNKPRFLNLETNPHLRHNAPGVVAMARFGRNPNSASCQFYITLARQPSLDNQYSIFGGVISGMDAARQIVVGDKILSIEIQGGSSPNAQ